MDNSSGVGVLDKAASVLSALEAGPATLAQLVAATHLARPTAHRLAVALEHHRLVARDMQGRFVLGPRLSELATAAGEDRLLAAAGPVLTALRDHTGESAQLYRRQGDQRICVAAAERPIGLRDSIPVGAADRAPVEPQSVEGLGRGDLVDEVEIDVEEVLLAVDAGADEVVVPDLLAEGLRAGRVGCGAHGDLRASGWVAASQSMR